MEVKIISKECIKPSSPTPHHLQIHKLSFFDEFIPALHVPLILFYQRNQEEDISERTSKLKQSLSETLTRFYPFAGTISRRDKDAAAVECNDRGACYVVAKVNFSLSEYLKHPDLTWLNKFVPVKEIGNTWSHITLIQENIFTCGGIVIGVFVSHVVADGTALSSFVKYWAATARNSIQEAVSPNFEAPIIFPQSDAFPKGPSYISLLTPFSSRGRPITRRFLYDASAIASLKAEAAKGSVENPTRVEVVSALLCKLIMRVFKERSGIGKKVLISHIVNLRRRAVPPFSEGTMGNLLSPATALLTNCGEANSVGGLVSRFKEAIEKIGGHFVKTLEGEGGYLRFWERMRENLSMRADDYIGFTSWCNFGHYDIDFGWGKPTWVSYVGASESLTRFMNSVFLLDAGQEKGIEAWVFLGGEDMLILEHDGELLSYASVNPSPLKLNASTPNLINS